MLITVADVEAEAERIAAYVVRTPTVASPGLSAFLGAPVTTKLELLQRTGSFKARGATAKLLALSEAERAAGVVAVSGGNHGIAVAEMAGALDIKATVVMPRSAPAAPWRWPRQPGRTSSSPTPWAAPSLSWANSRSRGSRWSTPSTTRSSSRARARSAWSSRRMPKELTDVLVSIGGGGLISGVAAALHARRPGVRVWGVETEGARAMSEALAAGGPVPVELSSMVSTLSAPSASPLTYEHVSALVTDVLTVTDAEAVQGILDLADHAKVWAEPAAGCLLPAARQVLERVGGSARLGLVICGGNATTADVTAWAGRFGLR